jgi:protein tyrosine phosphatase (PTP) superfamily phosphohydrolase (DUF442 family)
VRALPAGDGISTCRGHAAIHLERTMKHTQTTFLTLSLAAAVAGCGGSTGAKINAADPAINYHVVDATLQRGGRPDQPGLAALAGNGIRYIIDLEDDAGAIKQEQAWVAELGLQFRNAPMNGEKTPDDGMINDLLALLADPAQGPFFVHCQEGVDRTGLVIGLDRVFNDGWAAADAYDEMKALGFKTYLSHLRDYYSVKTGYNALE